MSLAAKIDPIRSQPAFAASKQPLPRLASLCGTYLKAEMQSIYRQIANVSRYENHVFAEQLQNVEQFPHPHLHTLSKLCTPRLKGNFLKRFWYKYVIKQWPPPVAINKLPPGPHFGYDLPKCLTESNIDVVHVYYGHKAVKYLPMLLHWGGPFIVSFHGVDVSKSLEEGSCPQELDQVFTHASLVLARSVSLLEELRKLGCPEEKLRLNRTPIPLEQFPVMPRQAPGKGAWKLVQASRLIPKKGIFTTLEALTHVVKEFPNLVFTLCGTGPEREAIKLRREELGLQKNVKLAGWQSQEQLREQYAQAHLFLHPSETTPSNDQEGIPNAMLEAMATGLPVVATNHGGIPEAVTHGEDGLLVEERSPRELADAILALLRDTELWQTLAEKAARNVRSNFGLPTQVANLEACYDFAYAAAKKGNRKSS
jgi:colanic acid/amylovoran biosynthesis glycosyltransferase